MKSVESRHANYQLLRGPATFLEAGASGSECGVCYRIGVTGRRASCPICPGQRPLRSINLSIVLWNAVCRFGFLILLLRSEEKLNKSKKHGIQLRDQRRRPRLPPQPPPPSGAVAAGGAEVLVVQLLHLQPGRRTQVRLRSGHPRGFIQVPPPQDEFPRPQLTGLPHFGSAAARCELLSCPHRGGSVKGELEHQKGKIFCDSRWMMHRCCVFHPPYPYRCFPFYVWRREKAV
ncbi:hypothetical protein Cni_G11244 [Canna indica]|uniref:Uncharacterized protein n=1 Tax=Canna indica TaxID=4628 RepID=A0AAQ3K7Q1_9LILI|nr:hypothetical protein Cni_G11244 [Canna indica]